MPKYNFKYPWAELKAQGDFFILKEHECPVHYAQAASNQARVMGGGTVIVTRKIPHGVFFVLAHKGHFDDGKDIWDEFDATGDVSVINPNIKTYVTPDEDDELDDMELAVLAFEHDPDNPDNQ